MKVFKNCISTASYIYISSKRDIIKSIKHILSFKNIVEPCFYADYKKGKIF